MHLQAHKRLDTKHRILDAQVVRGRMYPALLFRSFLFGEWPQKPRTPNPATILTVIMISSAHQFYFFITIPIVKIVGMQYSA
jgi:hypothetical protein